jgi:hypothetical protein
MESTKISVDSFYEKQKELYDICGNLINKDKYPFVDILSRYLTDIVELIDIEIKNSARNSMINWREKKNPKLLSKLINNDDNVNLINISMNKITGTNYKNIVAEISEALLADNYRKLPDYCKYLFDSVIKKCMGDEAFAKDYIRFLFGFEGGIANNLLEHITVFINEVNKFLTTNENIKDYSYFYYIKDVSMYRNVGIILANIFQLGDSLNTKNLCSSLEEQFGILFNNLDWLPVNMDELNGRLYLVMGVMELLMNNIWFVFNDKTRDLFNEILKMTYSCANIPNKIKFKVLDLQDMIKNIKHPHESTKYVIPVNPTVTNPTVANPVVSIPLAIDTNSVLSNSLEPVKVNVSTHTVNIWESRKQTMQNTVTKSVIESETTNNQTQENNFDNTINNHRSNNDNSRRNRSRQGGKSSSRDYRNRGSKIGSNSNINVDVASETSKNMFSGLEPVNTLKAPAPLTAKTPAPAPLTAKTPAPAPLTAKTPTPAPAPAAETTIEEDGFITVEKKIKNVYKPKKTPSLALEGGKIYSGSSGSKRK